MKKVVIKVFKLHKKVPAEKSPVVAVPPKVESEAQFKLVKIINNWISERGENRQMEKAFSESKIKEWKIMSKDFEETKS